MCRTEANIHGPQRQRTLKSVLDVRSEESAAPTLRELLMQGFTHRTNGNLESWGDSGVTFDDSRQRAPISATKNAWCDQAFPVVGDAGLEPTTSSV